MLFHWTQTTTEIEGRFVVIGDAQFLTCIGISLACIVRSVTDETEQKIDSMG